jgi:hypothetical protein
MLTREEHPCWAATCDKCGEGDNVDWGGSCHYSSEAEARDVLVGDLEWKLHPRPGAILALCPGCYEELRATLPCPHGARCTGACGSECPDDEAVFALVKPTGGGA